MDSKGDHRIERIRKRGRKALLWALLAFAVCQVGFRLALYWRPQIGDQEFGRKLALLRAQLADKPGRALVLMIGSSRVATGLRPEALAALHLDSRTEPIIFNFGQLGSGPVMTLLCLQRLLDAGIRPNHLLVECWPAHWYSEYSSDDYLAQPDLINLSCLGRKAMKVLGRYSADPQKLRQAWYETQLVPVLCNRRMLLGRLAPSWLPAAGRPGDRCRNLSALGWQAGPGNSTDRRGQMEFYRKHYGPRLQKLHTRGISDLALRETLALCRRYQIPAAVVLLPEGTEFRSWYPSAGEAQLTDYLQRLRAELAVPVIDARTWVPDEGFLDGHHLQADGAVLFTQRLGTDVLRPLLRGESIQ